MQIYPEYKVVTGGNQDNLYAKAKSREEAHRYFKEALRLRPSSKVYLIKWTGRILEEGGKNGTSG